MRRYEQKRHPTTGLIVQRRGATVYVGTHTLSLAIDCAAAARASMKAGHYETITGADSLAWALVEVHLASLRITAVAAPDNTIDR